MKKVIAISIVLNLVSYLSMMGQKTNDPYWEFNKEKHFRPQINKGEFYTESGFDFGWLVLEPMSRFVVNKDEIEQGKSFSYGQKALYYWWYLDGQVTNGGFLQYYYNGYGPYTPTIIKALEHIGDKEMAGLVKRAHGVYEKNKKLIEKARKSDDFGSDLYDKVSELSDMSYEYYDINEQTMSLIEQYIRKHPDEICVDEEGNEYDLTFTGKLTVTYEDGKIKEEFHLENGTLSGAYQTYYENGTKKTLEYYKEGKKAGDKKEWYENGNLKRSSVMNVETGLREVNRYYENGQHFKLGYLDQKDRKKGDYKEWYENGQLKEYSKNLGDPNRSRVEYWSNGNKKVEVDFKESKAYWKNYWNENGEQLLKDGTGLCITELTQLGSTTIYETEYKDYARHGISKTIRKGVLSSEAEYKNDKRHGTARDYYDNGNLKEEKTYKNGEEISSKEYPIFENPVVVTTISCEMKDKWLVNRELEVADSYPVPTNTKQIEEGFQPEISVFDGYPQDHKLSYSYFVSIDKMGKPSQVEFLIADNGRLSKEIEDNIKKMEFEPAKKNGENVNSYLIIKHKLKLGPSK